MRVDVTGSEILRARGRPDHLGLCAAFVQFLVEPVSLLLWARPERLAVLALTLVALCFVPALVPAPTPAPALPFLVVPYPAGFGLARYFAQIVVVRHFLVADLGFALGSALGSVLGSVLDFALTVPAVVLAFQ